MHTNDKLPGYIKSFIWVKARRNVLLYKRPVNLLITWSVGAHFFQSKSNLVFVCPTYQPFVAYVQVPCIMEQFLQREGGKNEALFFAEKISNRKEVRWQEVCVRQPQMNKMLTHITHTQRFIRLTIEGIVHGFVFSGILLILK